MEFALRGVIFKELNAKLGGLRFLKSKKKGGKVTSSKRVELIKEGNFDENIMGDEMKALVSTPE